MNSCRLFLIVSYVLAFFLPCMAQESQCDSLSVVLDDIVVTATRTPKPLKNVPIVTRLISSDEIQNSDASNIQDLLVELLPGLEFSYAMSQEKSLNMGGFSGSSVLFLVDGEPMAGETMDNIDYNRLNLDDIGKVEIIKGAASALYGAKAVGGVVNLISADYQEPWNVHLNSRYHSAGREWHVGGEANFKQGKWASATSAQYTTLNTIALTSPFDTKSQIHNIYGGNTLNMKERLIFHISDALKLTGRAGYFYRTNMRKLYTDRYDDYTAGLKCNLKGLEVSYAYDCYNKERLIDGVNTHSHDYSNRQHIIHLLYNHNIGKLNMIYGADYMHDFLKSYQFTVSGVHTQHSIDGFVQADYAPIQWLNILASLRDDYFSASGNNAVTGRLALMLRLAPLTVRASYAGGFRAPTLKEMYMDFDMAGISMIYGNPNLKPEKSHNFNLSLERSGQLLHGAYNLTASTGFTIYKNRITISEIDINGSNDDGARYYNESSVRTLGIDLTARYRSAFGLGLSISGNFLHVSGNSIDSQFSQPRPWSATWRLDYERRLHANYLLYVALSGRYLGKPQSNYETDGAYSLLKLTLRQNIGRGIDITLTADNLLNYRPKIYYWNSAPTTGLTGSVGVSLDLNKII